MAHKPKCVLLQCKKWFLTHPRNMVSEYDGCDDECDKNIWFQPIGLHLMDISHYLSGNEFSSDTRILNLI